MVNESIAAQATPGCGSPRFSFTHHVLLRDAIALRGHGSAITTLALLNKPCWARRATLLRIQHCKRLSLPARRAHLGVSESDKSGQLTFLGIWSTHGALLGALSSINNSPFCLRIAHPMIGIRGARQSFACGSATHNPTEATPIHRSVTLFRNRVAWDCYLLRLVSFVPRKIKRWSNIAPDSRERAKHNPRTCSVVKSAQ